MNQKPKAPSANPANVRQCFNSGPMSDTGLARPPASANAGRGYGGYIGEGRIGDFADENLPFLAVKIPSSMAVKDPDRRPRISRFGVNRESREAGRGRP